MNHVEESSCMFSKLADDVFLQLRAADDNTVNAVILLKDAVMKALAKLIIPSSVDYTEQYDNWAAQNS